MKENGLNEFIEKLKTKNIYLNQLQITYKPGKENPYAKLYCYGMEDVYSEDEYYENIYENLIAADLSWLNTVANQIRLPMEATVEVDDEGNFVNDEIKMVVRIDAPQIKGSVIPFLYHRIQPFILLNEIVDTVEVRGFKGSLQYVKINLKVDTKLFTTLLNKKKVNRSILEQWLASINNYVTENSSNQEIFENHFQVVNGKINVKYKMELVDQYFALATKEH